MGGIALLFGGIAAVVLFSSKPEHTPVKINQKTYTLTFATRDVTQKKASHAPSDLYYLDAATGDAGQERGLSKRTSMPRNGGMLFAYPTSSRLCFWMKDMYFNLDIIWLDASKKVVHIEENLSPDTYPEYFCADGRYVIELNAGEAAKSGLRTGQAVAF